jgi:ABC-type antimicrobial peptide transport system permease subunit
MANRIKTTKQFRFLSASLAFILWGGWAFFINQKETVQVGVTSGVTQGTASFLITLFLVHAVTRLYHQFNHPIAKLLFPAIVTVSFTGTGLLLIHSIAQTPRILVTILPAISVAFTFCLFTAYKLHKTSQTIGTDDE